MGKAILAIVGRPNVGKSTLFNTLAGEKISIVEDHPGVTRDRIYADVTWLNHSFSMIDTGGIEMDSKDKMLKHMREQADIAIDTADVILFLVDVRQGLVDADFKVADMLRKSGKPVILVVNKVEITACSCTAGKRDILVRSNGKVFPCQRFISDNYCMGDLIKSSSVDDIIKYHKNNIKELFKNSLKEIACDKCSVVDFCWTCPAEVINYDKEIDSEDICNGMKAFLDEKIWGKH